MTCCRFDPGFEWLYGGQPACRQVVSCIFVPVTQSLICVAAASPQSTSYAWFPILAFSGDSSPKLMLSLRYSVFQAP